MVVGQLAANRAAAASGRFMPSGQQFGKVQVAEVVFSNGNLHRSWYDNTFNVMYPAVALTDAELAQSLSEALSGLPVPIQQAVRQAAWTAWHMGGYDHVLVAAKTMASALIPALAELKANWGIT